MSIRIRWTILLALAALVVGAAPASAQSMRWIEGEWRWADNETGCDSAYTMRVGREGKYVVSSYTYEGRRDSSEYRVLTVVPGGIRAQIKGEKRKDAEGNPVIWDFIQLSEDAFCWRRADWDAESCTQPLMRCVVSAPGRDGIAANAAAADPWWRRRSVVR